MAAVARTAGVAARRGMAASAAQPDEDAMMGWVALLLLIALSLGALRLLGVKGPGFTAAAAALAIGGAGYALQGRPSVPGAPAQSTEAKDVLPLTQARHAFCGNFTPAEPWLRMSEALARDGKGE